MEKLKDKHNRIYADVRVHMVDIIIESYLGHNFKEAEQRKKLTFNSGKIRSYKGEFESSAFNFMYNKIHDPKWGFATYSWEHLKRVYRHIRRGVKPWEI